MSRKKTVAFCALGDNLRFQRDLAPYCVKAFHPFPDHHRYSPRDIETLKKSRAEGPRILESDEP